MHHYLCLAGFLLATAGTATAQPTAPPRPTPRTTSKASRPAAAPVVGALATATDWSLPYAASITAEGLKKDLDILASDAYEGRETGKKGQKMAADYIAKAFAGDGLTGPVPNSDNDHLQHFDMNRSVLDAGASAAKVGGKTYLATQDFYAFLADGTFVAPTAVKPVFIGYGIKEDKYSDFTGTPDYAGQDVVLLLGEPLDATGNSLIGPDGKPSRYASVEMGGLIARQAVLSRLGARSVTMILPTAAAFAQVPTGFGSFLDREQLTFVGTKKPRGLNFVLASPEYGAQLLGTTPAGLAQYRKAVAKAGKAIPYPFKPAPATVQLVMKDEVFTTENVLGYLEGTDKKDEVLVVSAHYDHLGVKNGVVFNGADDDGSGTVSVLAMARAFSQAKKDGHGPRRSILFLANTGEEEGLLGSKYYTDHPLFPLTNTVTNLNIDMIGRVDSLHQGKGDYVYVVGDDRLSQELHTVSEATNQQYHPIALDYKLNDPNDPERIYYRSDHYSFAKHSVPIIFYTSGEHPEYHKATDDVEKIDFPAMVRRDQLIFHTAWALANRDTRVALKPELLATGFTPTAADLDRYVGHYASAQSPLKITVTKEGTTLKFQGSQAAFPLEAVSKDVFRHVQYDIYVEFEAAKPVFTMKQNGRPSTFTKQ
jgi:hypothetical protein